MTAATSLTYEQQILTAPRPPGLAYVLYFCLGVLAVNTFYLVFEQEEHRFLLWAGLAAGFFTSWALPRRWRIPSHRLIDLASVLTLVWFALVMREPDNLSRFGNYLGQMVCIFLVLFSFRTYRHSDFSWLMVIAIVIMLLCSIPIYAASFIYSIFGFLCLLALAQVVLTLFPAQGDHREDEAPLTTPEWSGTIGRVLLVCLGIFLLCAGLFGTLPQRTGRADRAREQVREVFGVGNLSAATRNTLAQDDLDAFAGGDGSGAYSGFSESFDITTGRPGGIQEDVRPILEVRAPGQPYMRALVWDDYTGRSWERSATAQERFPVQGTLRHQGYGVARDVFWLPEYASQEAVETAALTGELQQAEIRLVGATSTGQGFLFHPWRTVMVRGRFRELSTDPEGTWKLKTNLPAGWTGDTDDYTLARGDRWQTWYRPVSPHIRDTQRMPLDPASRQRYTALPVAVPDSLRRLGQELAGNRATAWEAAMAVQRYLRSRKRYSLNPPVMGPEVADVASYWLEQTADGGHCELFATTAAVLLRAGGVPVRVVTGFSSGTYSIAKGAWVIRGKDAHAWCEIYDPTMGWLPFDPTPASFGEGFVNAISEVTGRVSRSLEQYFIYDPRGFWTRDFPAHVARFQADLVRTGRGVARWGGRPGVAGIPQGLLAGLPLAALLGWLGFSVPYWRYGVPVGQAALLQERRLTQWSWRQYHRLLGRAQRRRGVEPPPPGSTLDELAHWAQVHRPPLAEPLAELATPFQQYHYGAPAHRRRLHDALRQAWRRVRQRW